MIAKYKNGVAEWATHMFCRLLLISIPLTGFASPAASRSHVMFNGIFLQISVPVSCPI